jgi:hypothetical protein
MFLLNVLGRIARGLLPDDPFPPPAPPEDEPAFIEIYRPVSQQEVIALRMVLEREDVDFYITNEGLHSLFHIPDTALGDMRLMVERRHAERCQRIIRDELGFSRPD